MLKTAVIVPGLLGSSLFYSAPQGGEIWGADLRRNYKLLIKSPQLIEWTNKPASAALLSRIWWGFIPLQFFWSKLRQALHNHPDFGSTRVVDFAYDWRQSILTTAQQMGHILSKTLNVSLDSPPSSTENLKLTFLTHSLGGLVARAAIGLGTIHPGWLGSLIHLGSPLKGAPWAFRGLYGQFLPPSLQRQMTRHFAPRNLPVFTRHFSECIRTFPSLYQLLPHSDSHFLRSPPLPSFNPLTENVIPANFRQDALDAHSALEHGETLIQNWNLPCYSIYTVIHNSEETDYSYEVATVRSGSTLAYLIQDVFCDLRGDGTVPAASAASSKSAVGKQLFSVTHSALTNNNAVCAHLHQIL